ncbi:MAG TPA: hypothetical protein PLR65_05675, partial [Anaerolineales bacterium]|nr:hypothetical protein [Anaerolineales bacterium]
MVALARPVDLLIAKFGEMVKENAPLAPFTSARIGGPADLFVTVDSVAALARVVKFLWKNEL